MKTSLVLLSVAALLAAASFLSLAAAASLAFTAGLGAIAAMDYTRASRVLRLPATMAVGARTEKFGLAA